MATQQQGRGGDGAARRCERRQQQQQRHCAPPLCSGKEHGRGDREVWECSGNTVGIKDDAGEGMRAKVRAWRGARCAGVVCGGRIRRFPL